MNINKEEIEREIRLKIEAEMNRRKEDSLTVDKLSCLSKKDLLNYPKDELIKAIKKEKPKTIVSMKDVEDADGEYYYYDNIMVNDIWLQMFLNEFKFDEIDVPRLIAHIFWLTDPKDLRTIKGFDTVLEQFQ